MSGGPHSPSRADVSLRERLREDVGYLRRHVDRARAHSDLAYVFEDIDEYDERSRRHGSGPLDAARVLEIGFGARPYRLAALHSRGVDATGIDMEAPLLRLSPRRLLDIARRNGIERAVKSALRRALFDRREWNVLRAELRRRGHRLRVDEDRMVVGDAARADLPAGAFDVIYSEDVFEHVRREDLPALTARVAGWLSPRGVALIRPNVFTGITGGHLAEWQRDTLDRDLARVTEPWDHLRRAERRPNTQLNELTRAEYRTLFAEHFTILEEVVRHPDLGRRFLTPDVRAELDGWPEEELMSNIVLFVLVPKDRGA